MDWGKNLGLSMYWPLGSPGRGVPGLKSCNFAEGIESAEILQAVPSSEGDAFELTVSCQGG